MSIKDDIECKFFIKGLESSKRKAMIKFFKQKPILSNKDKEILDFLIYEDERLEKQNNLILGDIKNES